MITGSNMTEGSELGQQIKALSKARQEYEREEAILLQRAATEGREGASSLRASPQEGSERHSHMCHSLPDPAPTSGLKPLVKSFMRLKVGPRSTLLQFRRTLSRAWVAQELGISWRVTQGPT